MRLALTFVMLVTMVTAINLRKRYRPINDDLVQVANKLMNLFLKYGIQNKRLQLPLATGT